MALTDEEKAKKRYDRLLQEARKKQLNTYRGIVARDLQKAIRMEYALLGHQRAVVGSELVSVSKQHGECVCVTCGKVMPWKDSGCHAGHFLGGRADAIVFEETGIHPQCAGCNQFRYGAPEEYRRYMQGVYGEEVIQELEQRKRGFIRDVDGNDHKLVPSTREQLVARRIIYLDRIKAAQSKLDCGPVQREESMSENAIVAYEYGDISKESRQKLDEVADHIRTTGRLFIYGVGKLLLENKHRLPHGEFLVWVEQACDIKPRMAQQFMRVAEVFKSAESAHLEAISMQALIELSANNCPLAAVEEVLFISQSGYVSHTSAMEIIEKHKEAAQGLPSPGPKEKASPEPDEAEPSTEEGRDASVAGAIAEMTVSVEDQPDPEEPEALSEFKDLWSDGSFGWRCEVIKYVLNTSEYEHVTGTLSAAETAGVVDAESKPVPKRTKPTNGYTPAFEAFWLLWPRRKRSKKLAFTAWQKALDTVELDTLMDAVVAFAASPEGQSDYCSGPSPWLNQQRWDDAPEAWEIGANASSGKGNGTMEAVGAYLEGEDEV